MFSAIARLARAMGQRRRVSRELDDELQFHLEMEIRSHVERGVPYVEARRIALRDFGGVVQTKEAVRDVRTLWLESTLLDVRYALRRLRSHRAFTLAAVTMLGLAIGITTAMFTLVDALILRPIPFRSPEQLAFVYMGDERGGRLTVAPEVLAAWRASRAFAGVEAAVSDTALIELEGTVTARPIARVTPGLFEFLGGVRSIRGRLFDMSEGRAGSGDRVLLSEDVWRGLYGADAAITGRRIKVDGEWLTVVGVLPSDFRFPSWDTVMWRAADFGAASRARERPRVYVRFSNDMPRGDAIRIATAAAREADSANAALSLRVEPLAGMVLDQYYQRAVPLLAGGVLLVFLVLCANVGSLLLTRATARRREFGMRAALGASRARLVLQAVVESSLVGAFGIAAGAGIAWTLVSLTRAFLPEAFLLRTLNPLNLDGRALAVTAIAGLIAVLLAGFLPAWLGTRVDSVTSLRVTDRGGTDTRGARAATRVLLGGEIALACTLLLGATLLVRSFVNMARAGRGLDASAVLTARISLPPAGFPDRASRAAAARALEERVRGLPGVAQVAWSYGLPPSGGAISFGTWRSDAPGGRAVNLSVDRYYVGADFFALYGIPLIRGRSFQPSDRAGDVIVSERLAAALWPGLDPAGRAFTFDREQFHVIGIAREIRLPALDPRLDRPEFYQPFAGVGSYAMMSVRCAQACPDPALVRQRLVAAVPVLQVVDVSPLENAYVEQLARPRAAAALGFTFAFIGLLAAAGGLFAVLTSAVNRRRREFGIRCAMGASQGRIARLVFGDAALIVSVGLAAGALPAWAVARTLESLEYEVATTDPLTWAAVLTSLALTTGLASVRPVREAMDVDPALLLKSE